MPQFKSEYKNSGKPRSATSPISLFTLNTQEKLLKEKCDQCNKNPLLNRNLETVENKEEFKLDELRQAPDGGFGWIVVIASFFSIVIVDGILFSVGLLLLEISRDLGQSKGATAWIGSLQSCFYLIIGPIVSYLSKIYTCRKVALVGSCIASLGFAFSYKAQNLYVLCFTYGIMGGIGFGCIYLPSVVMVAEYFEEKRAFATGLAVCGAGIGGFIMAPITQYLNITFGWRYCVLILSLIILTCTIFSLFFQPIETYNQKRLQKEKMIQSVKEDEKSIKTLNDEKDLGCVHQHKSSIYLKVPESGRNRSFSNHVISSANYSNRRRASSRLSASTINFASATIANSIERFHSGCDSLNQTNSNEKKMINHKHSSQFLDMSLITKPSFIVFACGGFLSLSGFFIPFMYLADRALQMGINSEAAAMLLSAIGVTNTLARIACGWISDHPKIDPLVINNVALILGGAFTMLSPLICNTYIMLVIYSLVFGTSIASFSALRSVIVIDLFGIEKLSTAFGLVLFPQGMATVIGAPVAGWFYDITGSYDVSFYVAGLVILISGLICIPLKAISRWETRKLNS